VSPPDGRTFRDAPDANMTQSQTRNNAGGGLTDVHRKMLWEKLNPTDGDRSGRCRRRSPRLDYQKDNVLIHITHPGGGSTTCAVSTHDLSAGGISFFHSGFLHTGTKVAVKLQQRSGPEEVVRGSVLWCMHLGGVWHAIGVKFNETIFPRSFVSPEHWEQTDSNEPVAPEALVGEVLLLDDQEMDHELMQHMTKETKLRLTPVFKAAEAVEAVKRQSFDVACIDLNLQVGEPSGMDAIGMLRDANFNGPIVAVSVDAARHREDLKMYDVRLTLAKPYTSPELLSMFASALHIRGTVDSEPIYSELADTDGVRPLLEKFGVVALQSVEKLHKLIAANDGPNIRHVCQALRGAGRGYGYPQVSTAAADAVRAMDAGGDISEARAELQKLEHICRRICPEPRGAQ
jgi:CheY-like chemotaxis protein